MSSLPRTGGCATEDEELPMATMAGENLCDSLVQQGPQTIYIHQQLSKQTAAEDKTSIDPGRRPVLPGGLTTERLNEPRRRAKVERKRPALKLQTLKRK